MYKGTRGFTLIELLVVIAIIGLLMTTIMVSLGGAKAKARDARRQADIKNIQLALAVYYSENGMYPKNIYAAAGTAPNGGLAPAYLPTVPTDPNVSGSCTGTEAPCYKYTALSVLSPACNSGSNPPVKYKIGAKLEDASNSALTNDIDSPQQSVATTGYIACSGSTDFNGLTTDCSATPNGTDQCYDQTP